MISIEIEKIFVSSRNETAYAICLSLCEELRTDTTLKMASL